MYVCFQYYISATGNKQESWLENFKNRKKQENENITILWNNASWLKFGKQGEFNSVEILKMKVYLKTC